MRTYLFTANVTTYNDHGYGRQSAGFTRVSLRATDAYQAKQLFEGQYGPENVRGVMMEPGTEQEGW